MARIGKQLLRDAKAQAQVTRDDGGDDLDLGGRDVLTLLVKANTAKDLHESQRLSDEDVLARECLCLLVNFWRQVGCLLMIGGLVEVPTFLVAGHETTRYAMLASLRRTFLIS